MFPLCKPSSAPHQAGIARRVESPTPLHYAAADGDLAAVQKLLAEGADPNATAYFGMTPLHVVVKQYSMRQRNFHAANRWGECTKLLLEAGANPMLRCHPDTTPAGLGDGHVPPALRDAMSAMAAEGVWLEDERNLRQDDVQHTHGGAPRPGERSAACHRVSEQRLAELTAMAAGMERAEYADRCAVVSEHVRIGWWTSRNKDRHARAPKRPLFAVSKMTTA